MEVRCSDCCYSTAVENESTAVVVAVGNIELVDSCRHICCNQNYLEDHPSLR